MPFDLQTVRADFPILAEEIHGHRLVYLDSGASAQKPKAVLDRMTWAYEHAYANVHRGLHTLANRATEAYEGGREAARRSERRRWIGETLIVAVRGRLAMAHDGKAVDANFPPRRFRLREPGAHDLRLRASAGGAGAGVIPERASRPRRPVRSLSFFME